MVSHPDVQRPDQFWGFLDTTRYIGVKSCTNRHRQRPVPEPDSGHKQCECSTHLLAAALDERVRGDLQGLADLPRTLGHDPELLDEPQPVVRDELAARTHPPDGEDVPERLRLADVALERVVPRDRVRTVREVLLVLDLEADLDDCLARLRERAHLGDAVPDLNPVRDLLVLGDRGVPLVRHAPLVHAELQSICEYTIEPRERVRATYDSSGLEHLHDLAIHALPRRRVHGRLDGVHRVERVLAKLLRELHEVPDGVRHGVRQARLRGELARAADLEVVVVEADDVHVRELRDLARGSADAAADVEHAHAGLEVHLEGEVVLVPRERLVEALALVVPREVEGRAPAVLVETGGAIVVAWKGEGGVSLCAPSTCRHRGIRGTLAKRLMGAEGTAARFKLLGTRIEVADPSTKFPCDLSNTCTRHMRRSKTDCVPTQLIGSANPDMLSKHTKAT